MGEPEDGIRENRRADAIPRRLAVGGAGAARARVVPAAPRAHPRRRAGRGRGPRSPWAHGTDFGVRRAFPGGVALDPPSATGDLSGEPHLDDDYLVLSTVHSAKGQEWEAVHILNVADGNFPSY